MTEIVTWISAAAIVIVFLFFSMEEFKLYQTKKQ